MSLFLRLFPLAVGSHSSAKDSTRVGVNERHKTLTANVVNLSEILIPYAAIRL